MKILIVDDDRVNISLLSNYLAECGEGTSAVNGEDALGMIQQAMQAGNPYELVCLDIMMPRMNGHETLTTIREMEQSTYNVSGRKANIIMISALDDIGTIKKSFHNLCNAFLTKPVNRKELIKKVRELQDEVG